jgi:hypothetical protein
MEQVIPVESRASYRIGDSEIPANIPANNEANASGVTWAAVIGGGFVTAALSLILLALGTGLGLSSVSVWSNVAASTSTIGSAAIVWLIFMQFVSSSMGGYLAGRLRTKWANIHTDEVYFRDTAHGFLAWAVALVITAAFLASAATSMVGYTASSASGGTGGVTAGSVTDGQTERSGLDSNEYFVDSLFRTDSFKSDPNGPSVHREAGRIFASALVQGTFRRPIRPI